MATACAASQHIHWWPQLANMWILCLQEQTPACRKTQGHVETMQPWGRMQRP